MLAIRNGEQANDRRWAELGAFDRGPGCPPVGVTARAPDLVDEGAKVPDLDRAAARAGNPNLSLDAVQVRQILRCSDHLSGLPTQGPDEG